MRQVEMAKVKRKKGVIPYKLNMSIKKFLTKTKVVISFKANRSNFKTESLMW